ncbi:MAG: TlpA family protein disulfide reductase [Leptospiraceae bacterium]|nr:TlpA family protein disulfide reductase [Leptospiraceae bacterium]MDW7975141.1 TlpA disulfide reductase family protein [Leptospiraceae bacterium]
MLDYIKQNWLSLLIITLLIGYLLYQRIPLYISNSKLENQEITVNLRFQKLNGEIITLEDLKNKTIVLNFWATWCMPCKIEMPLLENTYNDLKDHVEILGITIEEKDTVIRYLENHKVSYPIILDTDYSITEYFNIMGYPSIIIIKDNKIVSASTGLNPLIKWKIRWYATNSIF